MFYNSFNQFLNCSDLINFLNFFDSFLNCSLTRLILSTHLTLLTLSPPSFRLTHSIPLIPLFPLTPFNPVSFFNSFNFAATSKHQPKSICSVVQRFSNRMSKRMSVRAWCLCKLGIHKHFSNLVYRL